MYHQQHHLRRYQLSRQIEDDTVFIPRTTHLPKKKNWFLDQDEHDEYNILPTNLDHKHTMETRPLSWLHTRFANKIYLDDDVLLNEENGNQIRPNVKRSMSDEYWAENPHKNDCCTEEMQRNNKSSTPRAIEEYSFSIESILQSSKDSKKSELNCKLKENYSNTFRQKQNSPPVLNSIDQMNHLYVKYFSDDSICKTTSTGCRKCNEALRLFYPNYTHRTRSSASSVNDIDTRRPSSTYNAGTRENKYVVDDNGSTTIGNRYDSKHRTSSSISNSTSSNKGKRRRHRTAFTPTQLLGLENSFERGHYIVGEERRQLATFLRLSETQIKVWFQNRRTKHKRQRTAFYENSILSGSDVFSEQE